MIYLSAFGYLSSKGRISYWRIFKDYLRIFRSESGRPPPMVPARKQEIPKWFSGILLQDPVHFFSIDFADEQQNGMNPAVSLLTFPNQLDRVRDGVFKQAETLQKVASHYADAIQNDGIIHVYANGHSRVSVEEMVVRMGALTGFRALLSHALSNFTDVVGPDGLRLCQAIEKVEGLGAVLLEEADLGLHDVLVVISATGQTQAAVDFALETSRRYPDNALVCIASLEQASYAPPKHSCGKTLYHVANEHPHGYFLDNCMPVGDLSTTVEGQTGKYVLCPLSSIGALTLVQSLNELTLRELDRRGYKPVVLQNMHLGGYGANYDEWLADQRQRYAKAMHNPNAIRPKAK
jgi:uncharacterized phosphosugar-binding protein